MLPQGDNVTFEKSSFFTRHTSLPPPDTVRAVGREQHSTRRDEKRRPPPATFLSLGLLVKYGEAITLAEGQCLWAVRQLLEGLVPVPEVYGWCTEGGQVFIYMELIQGVTLEERYPSLSPAEKSAIATQMKGMTRALRSLRQDPADQFVGKHLMLRHLLYTYHPLISRRAYWSAAHLRYLVRDTILRRTFPIHLGLPGLPFRHGSALPLAGERPAAGSLSLHAPR